MLGVTTQFQNARCHSTHLANLLYMSAVWSEVKHESSEVKHESLHVIVAAKPVRQHTYSSVRHHSYSWPTHHMSLRYQFVTQNQNMQSHLRTFGQAFGARSQN